MKRKFVVLLIISILFLKVGVVQGATWNDFTWIGGSFGSRNYEKATIYIPFKFNNSDEKYYLQLDTAAPSLMYENSIEDLNVKFKRVESRKENRSVISLDGILASYNFENKEFEILEDYGATKEELKGEKYKKIGDVGLDFFENNILILDFVNNRFLVANNKKEVPNKILKKSEFIDVNIDNHMLFLNTKIGNKKLSLVYDTASGVTPINTTEDIWIELTGVKNKEADVVLFARSWDEIARIKGNKAKYD